MLLGMAAFLHHGTTGEQNEVQNTPENNSEENEFDVQSAPTEEVVEDVVGSEEFAEEPA